MIGHVLPVRNTSGSTLTVLVETPFYGTREGCNTFIVPPHRTALLSAPVGSTLLFVLPGVAMRDSPSVIVAPWHILYRVGRANNPVPVIVEVLNHPLFHKLIAICSGIIARGMAFPFEAMSIKQAASLLKPGDDKVTFTVRGLPWWVTANGMAKSTMFVAVRSNRWLLVMRTIALRLIFQWGDILTTRVFAQQPLQPFTWTRWANSFLPLFLFDLCAQGVGDEMKRSLGPRIVDYRQLLQTLAVSLGFVAVVFHPLEILGRLRILRPRLSLLELVSHVRELHGWRGFMRGMPARWARNYTAAGVSVCLDWLARSILFPPRIVGPPLTTLPCPLNYNVHGHPL